MSTERRPWYKWYPKDFVVDEKVQGLSDDAELIYRRLLDILWQANDLQLPNNCLKLVNQIARGWTKERFENAWNDIQTPGFELLKTTEDGQWIYSSRLKSEAQKIEKISKIRSEVGKKSKRKQLKSNCNAIDHHTDTDTDTDNIPPISPKGKCCEKPKRNIIPPLVEWVDEYCLSRCNGIDPYEFHDFYQSKNWMVGKSKMKDWEASIRTWEKNKQNKPKEEENPYGDLSLFYGTGR